MQRHDLDCTENQILNYCWDPGNGRHNTLEPCLSQRPAPRCVSNTASAEVVDSAIGAMAPIAIGLAIGTLVVIGAGRAIASQLFGVSSHDPLVLSAAIVALTTSAVLALIIPARRAASIDPLQALRTEWWRVAGPCSMGKPRPLGF